MDEICRDSVVNVEALDEVRMLGGGRDCLRRKSRGGTQKRTLSARPQQLDVLGI